MNYRTKVELFFKELLDVVYPIRLGDKANDMGLADGLENKLAELLRSNIEGDKVNVDEIVKDFTAYLTELKSLLNKDIDALYEGDPAASSKTEIIIAYPGFYAIAAYRVAHYLYKRSVALIPRIITEHAHSYTGVDIHPAATIGESICIDHGSGVVIGETAVIGNHVKIYQGVTLGAKSIPKRNVPGKRHPTIEDNVVIYAQATILGGSTVIGQGSVIGGNVWLTKSIPPGSKVYYKSNNQNSPEYIFN